jgi:hypothetical protein
MVEGRGNLNKTVFSDYKLMSYPFFGLGYVDCDRGVVHIDNELILKLWDVTRYKL